MTRAMAQKSGLIVADASKISGADFLRAVFGGKSREECYAETLERCIRLIGVGHDMYGWPPLTVADARKLMAERAGLTEQVESDLRFTAELQRRRA